MVGNYGHCLRMGYSPEEYADQWVEDLYHDCTEYALLSFKSDHKDLPKGFGETLEISDELEDDLKECYYDACREAYNRYDAQLEALIDNFDYDFDDYEINEAEEKVSNAIKMELARQLEERETK